MDQHADSDHSDSTHITDEDAALILSQLTSQQVDRLWHKLYLERVEWRETAATVGRIGFWTWHAEDGFVELSRSWFRLYGLRSWKRDDERPIAWYLQRIHPLDRDRVWRRMKRALQRQAPQFTIRHRILLANGTTLQVIKRGGAIATKGTGANSLSGTDIGLTAIPGSS